MAMIGNQTLVQNITPGTEYFSGNGSTVTYTLSRPVYTTNELTVVVENVVQNPSSAYTVNSLNQSITFTSAPPTGINNIYIRYNLTQTNLIAPAQGSVQPSSLSNGGPYWNTSGNVGIGTNSPSAKLDVYTAATVVEARIRNDNGFLQFQADTDGVNRLVSLNAAASASAAFAFNGSGGTERMRIDSSGNVGVGLVPVANNTSKLQIAGDITRYGGSGGFLFNVYYSTANNRWEYASYAPAAGWVDAGTGNTVFLSTGNVSGAAGTAASMNEYMRIDSSGRIFAGSSSTVTPDNPKRMQLAGATVPVDSGAGAQTLTLVSTDTASPTDKGGALGLGGYSTLAGMPVIFGAIAGRYEGSGNRGYMQFTTLDNSGTMAERMRIDSSGNVGIGTNSPGGWKLNVAGNIISTYQQIYNGTSNEYVGMSLSNGWTSGEGISFIDSQGRNGVSDSHIFFGHQADYGSNIRFATQAAGTNTDRRTERMRIDSGGNVGIGTGAPVNKVDILTADNTGLTVRSTNYSGSFVPSTLGGMALTTSGAYPLIFYINSGERARFDSSGNFLMSGTGSIFGSGLENAAFSADRGTLSASSYNYILAGANNTGNKCVMFVNGSTRTVDGGANGLTLRNDGGPLTLGSSSYVTTTLSSSDYRNKENVIDYVGALADVMAVNVRKYNYINTGDKTQFSGFFAHELQAVAPYAVINEKDEVDDEGNPRYQAVDLSKIVPVLWCAIQEQQVIINNLTERLVVLEAK